MLLLIFHMYYEYFKFFLKLSIFMKKKNEKVLFNHY